jgi:hypothetical protein
MNIYEFDGHLYNLDQLVSLSEESGTGGLAWKASDGRVLILMFSGGRSVELPLSEREKIERLIRPAEDQ